MKYSQSLETASVSKLRFPLSDEHKDAISASMRGRKKTRSHRDAIAASAPGWSDEARRRSKATRMHKADSRRRMKLKLKQIDAEETLALQRGIVKKLDLITSPQIRMMFDRKYVSSRTMTPKELAVLWTATAKQHGLYHGKSKFGVTAKGMKAFVKLRAWLADIGIYPERYFRAIFSSAEYARRNRRAWQPFVTASMSHHYFETYVEWEKRLRTHDEGWIELLRDTGVNRMPPKVQDSMLESAESLAHIAECINDTVDGLIERYFVDLSPYLLYFMPGAQDAIARGRGSREQHMVFRALARDERQREKFRPFYEAATKYFKIHELQREKRTMAKAKIERTLRDEYDKAVEAAGIRLDQVDPASL